MKNAFMLFVLFYIMLVAFPTTRDKPLEIVQCKIERISKTQYVAKCPKVQGRSIASFLE